MSIQLKVKYLAELPPVEKKRVYSKYELVLRQFMLEPKPVAQIKAPSSKQAATIVSSFRREIKNHGYPQISVMRRDTTIFLLKKETEGDK